MKSKLQRLSGIASSVLAVIIIIISGIIIYTSFAAPAGKAPDIGGFSVFQIMTPSMEPELKVNTLIVTKKVNAGDIEVGDIISFYSSDPALEGAVNTHRVDGIEERDEEIIIFTKGDANLLRDAYAVRESQLVGRVIFSSFFLGRVVLLAKNRFFFAALIIIPLILILTRSFIHFIRTVKEEAEKEYAEETGKTEKPPENDGNGADDRKND